jgi:uncharacterized protein YjbI with pentapeptide repeats
MSSRRSAPLDNDDFAVGADTLSRKQVQEMLRKGQSFVEADLRSAELSGLSFDGVDMRWAKLAEAELVGCSFRKANLSGASFWSANLQNAVLDGAQLEGTDFDFAFMDGCTLKGAHVRKSVFPLGRLTMDQVQASIRTGEPLRMEQARADEDED